MWAYRLVRYGQVVNEILELTVARKNTRAHIKDVFTSQSRKRNPSCNRTISKVNKCTDVCATQNVNMGINGDGGKE